MQTFIHLWAQGLSKADEQPPNTPHGVQHSLADDKSVATLCWCDV